MKKRRKNIKTINNLSEVVSLQIKCGNCEFEDVYKKDDVSIIASTQDCEICGGHGAVFVNLTCSNCKINLTITMESW